MFLHFFRRHISTQFQGLHSCLATSEAQALIFTTVEVGACGASSGYVRTNAFSFGFVFGNIENASINLRLHFRFHTVFTKM